jgi:hypothetical protein
MLLQTNSYVVPKEKRTEHSRLVRKFQQAFARLGCDTFEVYEQVGANWTNGDTTGRFVQLMRFRDRKHQLAVQTAERTDPVAQQLIQEFCELINFPYQQQQGLFAVGFYNSILPGVSARPTPHATEHSAPAAEADQHEESSEQSPDQSAEQVAEQSTEELADQPTENDESIPTDDPVSADEN